MSSGSVRACTKPPMASAACKRFDGLARDRLAERLRGIEAAVDRRVDVADGAVDVDRDAAKLALDDVGRVAAPVARDLGVRGAARRRVTGVVHERGYGRAGRRRRSGAWSASRRSRASRGGCGRRRRATSWRRARLPAPSPGAPARWRRAARCATCVWYADPVPPQRPCMSGLAWLCVHATMMLDGGRCVSRAASSRMAASSGPDAPTRSSTASTNAVVPSLIARARHCGSSCTPVARRWRYEPKPPRYTPSRRSSGARRDRCDGGAGEQSAHSSSPRCVFDDAPRRHAAARGRGRAR